MRRIDLVQLLDDQIDGVPNLLFTVQTGNEETQSRSTLLNRRVEDRLHVDSSLEQRLGELEGVHRVPQNDGDHRRVLALSRIDPATPGKFQK